MIDKLSDLKDRIFFTIGILILCRFGSYVPLAGIDSTALAEFTNANSSGLLGVFNVLSGGSLGRMSIFALAIMPYITASIIVQLLTMIHKPLEEMKKEGEAGRRKINQITRMLTIVVSTMQAYAVAASLAHSTTSVGSIVVINKSFFILSAVITLVVGTVILMWFGEQISSHGIGNGASLIIFTGIVSGVPSAIISTFELTRKGAISPLTLIIILASLVGIMMMVVLVERSQRKVMIHYPKRQIGNKLYDGGNTYLPLKINTSGVIPPIFASTILLFPLTIASFSAQTGSGWGEYVQLHLNRGKPLFAILNAVLIIFFSFFYTAAVFNSEETADNLHKYGAYVEGGRRPGKHTAEFFDYILVRLNTIGALYLCIICVIPDMIANQISLTFALGGTTMLIVVNVILDTFAQIQSYTRSNQYPDAIKKIKLKK